MKLIISAFLLWIGCGSMVLAQSQPQHLDTRFEAFKLAQQQHDAQLMTGHAEVNTKSAKVNEKKAAKTKSEASGVVQINQMDVAMLDQMMKGIGTAKAQAIVDYRQAHGPFKRAEDLLQVKGIGPAIIEKNRQVLRFDD